MKLLLSLSVLVAVVLAVIILVALFLSPDAQGATSGERRYIKTSQCVIQMPVAPAFCVGHGGWETCRWNFNYTIRSYREFTVLFQDAHGRSTVWGVVTTPTGRLRPVHAFTGPRMSLSAFRLYAREQTRLATAQEWEWGCLEPIE